MKKRAVSLGIAVLLLVLAALPLTTLALEPMVGMTWNAYVKTNTGQSLHLRTGPSTNYDILCSIPYGAQVVIAGDYDDGAWRSVYYGDAKGYVMNRYLVWEKPGPKPTAKPKPAPGPNPTAKPSGGTSIGRLFDGFQMTSYHVSVRPSTPGSFVHMRWAPTKEAGIIRDYHQNDMLEVLSQNNTWAQVRDPNTGITGFMMRSLLSDIGVGEGIVQYDDGSGS